MKKALYKSIRTVATLYFTMGEVILKVAQKIYLKG
jgi:hypothetical protein